MSYIEIRLPKQLLVITEAELNQLLQKDPDLWERCLRRGKFAIRVRKNHHRQAKP